MILVVIITTVLSFLVVPQSWLHFTSYLPDHNDTLLITYIINQVQYNILHHQNLWWGSFFAPFPNTLTFSEPFLTTSIYSLPLKIITTSPVAMFNLNLLWGFMGTTLTLFLLLKYLTKNNKTAILGALLFTYSGIHLKFIAHLQIFNLWLLPLGILSFEKFLKTHKKLHLIGFLFILGLLLIDSILVAYFLFFVAIALYIANPIPLKKSFFVISAAFLCVYILAISPYLSLNHTYPEAIRPIRDAAHFSLSPLDVFLGFDSLTLILVFLWSYLKGKPHSNDQTWLKITLFSLIMSLGPVLKWQGYTVKLWHLPIPLPYVFFYYFFPGFQGMRTPSRWLVLAGLSAVIYLSIRLKTHIDKLNIPFYLIIIVGLLTFSLWENHVPLSAYPVDLNLPTVYEQVKALPQNTAIIEIPIKLWNMPDNQIESLRSLYSLYHQHRRLNGYSGFAPLSWIDLVNHLNSEGINSTNSAKLRSWGIDYVVENNQLRPL